MIFSAIVAGLGTGMMLGLLGSGGSIIALPALLYLLHVEHKSAIAMSLGVVAVTATLAALVNWRRGLVDTRVALVFGLFGVAGTSAGSRIGVMMPAVLQLGLFALVMYAAAWHMLKHAKTAAPAEGSNHPVAHLNCPHFFSPCMGRIALHGVSIGVLTSLVGVGGGFLIVPALVLLSGIPMRTAIGTSLAIVAANSYAGFIGYLRSVPIDWIVMLSFTAITLLGSLIGARFSTRVPHGALKKGFAWFLIVVATYILFRSVLFRGGA